MARDIFDNDPDPEFYHLGGDGILWDSSNRPLGNIIEHAADRLLTCYAGMEAARLAGEVAAADLGDWDSKLRFAPAGAIPQDRMGSTDYPSAHLAPCNLRIAAGTNLGNRTHIYHLFKAGVTRGHVQSIFGETRLIHVIANRADSRMEGWRRRDGTRLVDAFADSCSKLAHDRNETVRGQFFDEFMAKYRAIAGAQLRLAEAQLLAEHPDALSGGPAIVDQWGVPYSKTPGLRDTRIHSTNPEAWRANRSAMVQVLRLYHGANPPGPERIATILNHFKALRHNEETHDGWKR